MSSNCVPWVLSFGGVLGSNHIIQLLSEIVFKVIKSQNLSPDVIQIDD